MNKKFNLVLPCFCWLASFSSIAQISKSEAEKILPGTWKGSSICQIKNSPCHDETVVYHISRQAGNDTFYIQASKMVNGEELDMGTLQCLFNDKNSRLESTASHGNWSFLMKENELQGTLIYRGELFRKVSVTKVQ